MDKDKTFTAFFLVAGVVSARGAWRDRKRKLELELELAACCFCWAASELGTKNFQTRPELPSWSRVVC